jgi:hypothetical protein
MEISYDDLVEVTLFKRQLPLLFSGHFPCGWALNSPDEFPDQAAILVY